MGVIQLPDELQSVIDRQVAEGKAASPAAFLEEAVRRLVEETAAEHDDLRQSIEAGAADIEAGRYRRVAAPDDEHGLHKVFMTRLRSRLPRD